MRNPFEFAKELLQYVRGELSEEKGRGVEQVLSEISALRELAGELKERECIEREIRLLERFDPRAALGRIERRRHTRKAVFVSWAVAAAAVVVLVIGVPVVLLRNGGQEVSPLSVVEKPGRKAAVTLKLASGVQYHLDTLASVVRNDCAQVIFENRDGILKIQEEESSVSGDSIEEDYNMITVPYGGTYLLELCDGTKVYLNSGTVFEFPSRFSGPERGVRLKGEAYFDVAKNEHQPFIVETGGMSVKVLGTSFNIKSYFDEPGVFTTLVEGSVAILREGQPEKRISPGEQAYYDKGGGTLSVFQVDVSEFTAWKDGLFYFKDIALEEILRIVARWYDLEIFYMNQGVKSVVYSGKLPMYSSVEDVLRKFEISGEVRFELKGRMLLVFDR